MNLKNVLTIIFVIFIGIFLFYTMLYLSKKQIEYKNDERWQFIQTKRNQVANLYYIIILSIATIAYVILSNSNKLIMIRLDKALECAFYILLFKMSFIDLFSVHYFDKHI